MNLAEPVRSAPRTSHAIRWLVISLLLMLVLAACNTPAAIQPVAPQEADAAADADATDSDAADSDASADSTQAAIPAGDQEFYKDIPVGFTEEGFPYRGDPNAPITMYEFSDLQCPFCQRYFIQTEPAINENYVRNGDLRVVFRDLPLAQLHPNAPAAHIASICVADQGSAKSYWEMHEQLFRSVDDWANAADPSQNFVDLASELGLDVAAFEACLVDEAKATLVEERVAEAMSFGFSGTPSFQFVREETGDVYQIVGAQPFDQFAQMIDTLMAGETPAAAAQAESGGDQETPAWATAEGLQPDPDRPGYTMAGDQYRGNPDAAVVVVEFSDFQCPFCQRHTLDTQPILDETFVDTDEVFWVYKHFPLSIHPQAPAAGVAAECAAEQDQFWEMHHLLFTNSSSWSVSDPTSALTDLAAELGLDVEQFAACLADEEMMARVDSDLADGAPFVRGTPTFIVLFDGQGSIIPGALPADRFVSALQEMVDGATQ